MAGDGSDGPDPTALGQALALQYQNQMPQGPAQSLAAALVGPPVAQADMSPAFKTSDSFTAAEEGGKTNNDGNGGAAAFGIDQNANPGTMGINSDQAQAMRYQYWQAIGGDQLAAQNPHLATAAYDTAIMSGPAKAQQLLAASGGDPIKFMTLRQSFLTQLGQRPGFTGAAQGWANRNRALTNNISQPIPSPSMQANNLADAGFPS